MGPDFTIALKLNASDFKEEGFGFEDCKHVVKIMSDLGIDLIEISGGNYETPVLVVTMRMVLDLSPMPLL